MALSHRLIPPLISLFFALSGGLGLARAEIYTWGSDERGQQGREVMPVAVDSSEVLAGKTIATVTAGTSHTVALASDGRLYAWGHNGTGQLGDGTMTSRSKPVAVATHGALAGKVVSAVSAGNYHTVAATSDGKLYAWGDNYHGQLGIGVTAAQTTPIAVTMSGALAGKSITAVAAGESHTVALASDGQAYAWGYNFFGQLGDGSATMRTTPVAVTTTGALAGKTITAIAAGASHTVALTSEGKLYAWGANIWGQLGDGTTDSRRAPVAVVMNGSLADKTIIAVAAGLSHTVALASDGTLLAWGLLGPGTLEERARPAVVELPEAMAGKTITAVAASGGSHAVALASDGSLFVWGANGYGQLGDGTVTSRLTPVAVSPDGVLSDQTITAVFTGGAHTVVQAGDGKLYAWGAGGHGQLGDGVTNRLAPSAVATSGALGGKTITALAAGNSHTLALASDGTLLAWGYNLYGQLGDGTTSHRAMPVVALTASGALANKVVSAIAAGANHSVALTSDGAVYAWGSNGGYGQLGHGNFADSSVPVPVTATGALAGKTVTAIAAGAEHTVVLAQDGTLHAWGDNAYGQLGDGTSSDHWTPTTVNMNGALAGKTITVIAAGAHHTVALASDGSIYAWGRNEFGQLGDGTAMARAAPVAVTMSGALAGKTVTAIAAGAGHTLALASDGTLYAWGQNTWGQLGDGGTLGQRTPVAVTMSGVLAGKAVVAIAAGSGHSVALTSDGGLYAWGYNFYGQLGDGTVSSRTTPVMVTQSVDLAGKAFVLVAAGGHHTAAVARKPSQTILFVEPGTKTFGDAPFELSATASSGLPVTFEVISGPATVSGSTVTLTGAGTVTVRASQVGDADYAPAEDVERTFVVSAAAQTIYFSEIGTRILGEPPLLVHAISSSGLPVDFAVVSGPASVEGARLTLHEAGMVTVRASQAGDADHLPAPPVEQTFRVALGAGRRLYAWGLNGNGQLGDGSQTRRDVPVAVTTSGALAGKTITAVAAGYGHTVALTSEGRLYAWGRNDVGQLGDGTTTGRTQPVAVSTTGVLAGKTIVAVAAGSLHTVALTSEGKVYAWGWNQFGGLGDGTTVHRSAPVAVSNTPALSGKTIIAIAAGKFHTLALAGDGTLFAWGRNYEGQLAIASSETNQRTPAVVPLRGSLEGRQIVAVAGGGAHTVAVTSDGTLHTWGENGAGQLGDGSTTWSDIPVQVAIPREMEGRFFIAAAAGEGHTVARAADGTLFAWGWNAFGQLGGDTTGNSSMPVMVVPDEALLGKFITQVAAGRTHTVALASDGTVFAWGQGADGQLGDGRVPYWERPMPVRMDGALAGRVVTAIAAGDAHTVAIAMSSLPEAQAITFANPGSRTFGDPPFTLHASATSGLPVSVAVVSGPATLSGSTLTLTGVGTVTLRASQAGNTDYAPAGDVQQSFEVLSAFDTWRAGQFTPEELEQPAISGPLADADGDGLSNLMEYALGSDARSAASAVQPLLEFTGSELSFRFLRARADVTYVVEGASTLAPEAWHELETNPGTVGEEVTVVDTVPVGDTTPRRFLRLRVTVP